MAVKPFSNHITETPKRSSSMSRRSHRDRFAYYNLSTHDLYIRMMVSVRAPLDNFTVYSNRCPLIRKWIEAINFPKLDQAIWDGLKCRVHCSRHALFTSVNNMYSVHVHTDSHLPIYICPFSLSVADFGLFSHQFFVPCRDGLLFVLSD